jgi:hypothetical protein
MGRETKENKMISRLNLRIRFSYAFAQLISRSRIAPRLAASINAILISERVAPFNKLLPYFSPWISVAFWYAKDGQSKHGGLT